MSPDAVRARAVARGRVQMVGFRAFLLRHARDADLRGTVRNLPDGGVECVLEGPRPRVDQVIERMRRGPAHARVDTLDVEWLDPAGDLPVMTVSA